MAKKEKEIREICRKYPNEVLRELLAASFWPEGLEMGTKYERYDDDTREGKVRIQISENDGDVWISTQEIDRGSSLLRFRTPYRGESEYTHKALKMLALAIKLDNDKRLQDRSE